MLSAVALIVLASAAVFLVQTEKQIAARRQSVRVFDLHAREASERLADVRAAQQAYVAAGQGMGFWVPKVASLLDELARGIDALRSSAASPGARGALMEAGATITEFGNVDRRAREYMKSGQVLMAGDVVFTEGGETASSAARQVESARLAELQALDGSEAGLRRRQAMAMGAAAGFGVLILALLALTAPRESAGRDSENASEPAAQQTGDLMLRGGSSAATALDASTGQMAPPRGSVPLLKAAAELCTELGRVNDAGELEKLMARAADVLDASGLVVWVGNTSGADLRPVLAHGYPENMLARMSTVARSADNAAAAAYRTGALQIVLKRPGISNGAVVAPLLAPDGCIGALSAEIIGGSETSDGVQALAALLAAQLTGVVAGSIAAAPPHVAEPPAGRIASA